MSAAGAVADPGARKRPLPRFALTREEAAAALGMSVDFFDQYVRPEVRVIRKGRLRLFLPRELERWAEENAEFTLERAA